MRVISLIFIVLFCGCITKKGVIYDRYYFKDSNSLLLLKENSVFVIQDFSHFVSNGTVVGKYFLNESGELCIDSLIERLKLPYLIVHKPLINDDLKVVVNIEEDVYSNINVFIRTDDKEVFLGSLDKKGNTEFIYNKEWNDTVRVLFKYDRSIGVSYNSNYEVAHTESIGLSKGYNEIKINFDSYYFDLKTPNEVDKRCFKIRKNIIY
jgi:hypothetical protein